MMILSTSIAVASLLFSQLSSAQDDIYSFTLSTYNPNKTLHGQDVNAGGLAFYLGLPGPKAYCPVEPTSCPPGDETVVYDGGMQLSVVVPGGQQTYIAPSGIIGYTQAHSASMPPGSYFGGFTNQTLGGSTNQTLGGSTNQTLGGFTNQTLEDDTGVKSIINWETPGNSNYSGILACPSLAPYINATYQIYARTPMFNQTNCVELTGLLLTPQTSNDAGAWQYT